MIAPIGKVSYYCMYILLRWGNCRKLSITKFIKLTEIIKIGDRILDPLNKLAISLYTYIFPRRRLNFLLMYYTHKIFDQIKNANKHKSYITANRKYIFSRYKTDSTYDQKIINCPEEIYQKIIYLNYENIAKLSLKN